jgi:rhodanese-related sulfurtransferase
MENETSIPFRRIEPGEAARLAAAGAVRVLDVRTPREFVELGHIPGATLLPVDWMPSALATIPAEGKPLLICCEHGIRSARAAWFLGQAGYEVLDLAGGMSAWMGPRDHGAGDPFAAGPSSWLVLNADLLPRGGRALDVACGRGRNALLLAAAGFEVRAVDRDPERIEALRSAARRVGLSLEADVVDLEAEDSVDLGDSSRDIILAVHYLHRPLFPALARALRPGGILLYETFTVDQAARGKPSSPAHLLERGELARLVAPLEVLRERDGEFEGRMVAAVAARRPG